MRFPAAHPVRVAIATMCVLLLVTAQTLPQVIIKEKISIDPRPPNVAQSTSGTDVMLVVTFSYSGSMLSDMPRFLRATNCGTDQFVDPMSGSAALSIPARSGWNTTLARWSVPSGTSGTARLKIEIDGVVLREDFFPVSCFCTLQMNPEVFLYSGMRFIFPSSMTHGQSAPMTMTNQPFTLCSKTVWHPLMRTTISITQGANLGSFYDADGNRLGTSVTGNQFELSKIRYVADGEQPQGGKATLKIEASSQGVTVGSTDVEIESTSVPPVIDSLRTSTGKTRFPVGTAVTLEGYFHDEDNDVILADWLHKPGSPVSSSVSGAGAASSKINSPYSRSFSPVIGGLYTFQFFVTDEALNTVSRDLQVEFVDLDHFTVLVNPDTIGYREAATLRVIAKDKSNNELDIDGNTLVRLTVDNSQFGSYVLNGTDTMRTKDLEVFYTLVRSDRVKFVSNLLNPITLGPKTLKFTAVKSLDQSKAGSANLTIWEKATIKIELGHKELRPLGDSDNKSNPDNSDKSRPKVIDFARVGSTTATVVVTDKFQKPVVNYPFRLAAFVQEFSGGHDHTGERPTGRFISEKDTLTVVQELTEATGKRQYKYLSSGIGGVDSLFAIGVTKIDTASAKLFLRIPQLQHIGAGEHYVLVGQFGTGDVKSKHKVNHFGTMRMVGTLKALADSAYADSGYVFRFNDISLADGGPFDIKNNWNTGHQTHREGVTVDIDEIVSSGVQFSEHYLKVWLQIIDPKATIRNETDHYHVTIK